MDWGLFTQSQFNCRKLRLSRLQTPCCRRERGAIDSKFFSTAIGICSVHWWQLWSACSRGEKKRMVLRCKMVLCGFGAVAGPSGKISRWWLWWWWWWWWWMMMDDRDHDHVVMIAFWENVQRTLVICLTANNANNMLQLIPCFTTLFCPSKSSHTWRKPFGCLIAHV